MPESRESIDPTDQQLARLTDALEEFVLDERERGLLGEFRQGVFEEAGEVPKTVTALLARVSDATKRAELQRIYEQMME